MGPWFVGIHSCLAGEGKARRGEAPWCQGMQGFTSIAKEQEHKAKRETGARKGLNGLPSAAYILHRGLSF